LESAMICKCGNSARVALTVARAAKIGLLAGLLAVLASAGGLMAQTTITSPSVTSSTENPDDTKIRIRRTRPVDENKIKNIEQQRKGSDIFGLFLGGVSGVFNWQTLDSSVKAGRLADDISGTGLGAMFDFNLAG